DSMPKYPSALDNGVDRLFHYQPYNLDYLKNTILHGIVRFARASEFNDPWDCKPSFHVPQDAAEIQRLIKFMYEASERHTPEMDAAERVARAKHYLENPDDLQRVLANSGAEMWAQMD